MIPTIAAMMIALIISLPIYTSYVFAGGDIWQVRVNGKKGQNGPLRPNNVLAPTDDLYVVTDAFNTNVNPLTKDYLKIRLDQWYNYGSGNCADSSVAGYSACAYQKSPPLS